MRIGDVMTRDVTVVSPHASVRDAARKMDQLNVGASPVCDGTRLVGMVTDRDITVRSTATGSPPDVSRVHEIMTDDVRWCFEDDPVEQAEQEMSEVQIRRLPVIDRRKNLVGIVSLGDLATDHAPGTEDTLRRISEPSEPDRSGTLTSARGAPKPQIRPSEAEPRAARAPNGDYGRRRMEPGEADSPWTGYGRGTHVASDRGETGLGASGMDYGERYQGGYGADNRTFGHYGVDSGFRYGSGGYGAKTYGRAYAPEEFDRDYGRSRQASDRARPVFDRAEELGRPGSAQSYRGRGPRGYRRSDERIREDINEFMLADPEMDATNIEVEVSDSEITLSGTVASRYDKRRAEDIADSVPGAKHVQNNLRIVEEFTTGNASGVAGTGPGGRTPPKAV